MRFDSFRALNTSILLASENPEAASGFKKGRDFIEIYVFLNRQRNHPSQPGGRGMVLGFLRTFQLARNRPGMIPGHKGAFRPLDPAGFGTGRRFQPPRLTIMPAVTNCAREAQFVTAKGIKAVKFFNRADP